jgi:hypothetical protein
LSQVDSRTRLGQSLTKDSGEIRLAAGAVFADS